MKDREHASVRDWLVVILTLPTGAVDAACFLHLGHVFTSVVTGTMVLLGVAAGTHDPDLAVHCAVALVSYPAGVLLGAPLAERRARPADRVVAGWHALWPHGATLTLAVEIAVLAVFCAGWELTGGHPSGSWQLILLAVVAVAMGMQGAAVRQLGRMSTTYLTGTLTGVIASLATRSRPDGLARSLGVFAALMIGALLAAVVTASAPLWLPAIVLPPIALVVVLGSVRS